MKKEFLMGSNDLIDRSITKSMEATNVSDSLMRNLIQKSLTVAIEFYCKFYSISHEYDIVEYYNEYIKSYDNASKIGLFEPGGIRLKDHLSYWCLGRVLKLSFYVESGVFIGSSLHAFLDLPTLKGGVAIDPKLEKLKIPKDQMPQFILREDKDFGEIDFPDLPEKNLLYFDDHINTAKRIIQAHEKGFRQVLFDDSTGIEGICQRLYPAYPTIPMIMNFDLFQIGDKLSWSFQRDTKRMNLIQKGKKMAKAILNPSSSRVHRLELVITQEILDLCEVASKLIKKCTETPDLGIYLPQKFPEKMVDTRKYLVQLVD